MGRNECFSKIRTYPSHNKGLNPAQFVRSKNAYPAESKGDRGCSSFKSRFFNDGLHSYRSAAARNPQSVGMNVSRKFALILLITKRLTPRSSFAQKWRIPLKAKEIALVVRLSPVFSTSAFIRPTLRRSFPTGVHHGQDVLKLGQGFLEAPQAMATE